MATIILFKNPSSFKLRVFGNKIEIMMKSTISSTVMFIITNSTFPNFLVKFFHMGFLSYQLQIFNSVIKFISVQMMYYFSWFKVSTNSFFHNKSVFKNKAISFGERVFRLVKHFVAIMDRAFTSSFLLLC